MDNKHAPAHIPGPWDIVEGKTLIHVETAEGHKDGPGCPICWLPKSKQATATLIAAAPELLEALQDLVKAYDVKMRTTAMMLRVAVARDVIRKANHP